MHQLVILSGGSQSETGLKKLYVENLGAEGGVEPHPFGPVGH